MQWYGSELQQQQTTSPPSPKSRQRVDQGAANSGQGERVCPVCEGVPDVSGVEVVRVGEATVKGEAITPSPAAGITPPL